MDETKVAPMRARHHFEDGARLAVTPEAEDDPLVYPLHVPKTPVPTGCIRP
jgi:hypothetical protein